MVALTTMLLISRYIPVLAPEGLHSSGLYLPKYSFKSKRIILDSFTIECENDIELCWSSNGNEILKTFH